MTERPDDRELEQYLQGDSKLSRRYRDASKEQSPPDLDEAILARARAEVGRKPSLNRYLAPVALAASLVLGVNLAWNLYQVEPVPSEVQRLEKAAAPVDGPAAAPPAAPVEPAPAAPAPEARRRAPAATLEESLPEADTGAAAAPERELAQAQARNDAEAKAKAEARAEDSALAARQAFEESRQRERAQAQGAAGTAAPSAALAAPEPAPLTEAEKIDRLIAHVTGLQGAVFIRNGKEHGPAEAAKHLQRKREAAEEQCDTAEEFIRVCASFSSRSGEAYLIRFADGRTRTAEDVLRERLAALERR